MKLRKRKVALIISGILGLLVVSSVLITYYKITGGESVCSKEDMKFNAEIVENSEVLPSNFYTVWDKLFPGSRNVSMIGQLFYRFHSNEPFDPQKDCKCDDIGYTSWNNHQFDWKYNKEVLLKRGGYFRFGLRLQKYSSPEKCFDFWINHDAYHRAESRYFRDLEEFSNVIFSEGISDLDDEDIIILIAHRLMGTYPTSHVEHLEHLQKKLLIRWNEED